MANDNIPSWKHTGCGGSVYLDEAGFFCRRCGKKLSVPLKKVPRKLLRGTPFEARIKRRKEMMRDLAEVVSIIAEVIKS